MIAILGAVAVYLAVVLPGAVILGKGLKMCERRDRQRRGLS